MSQRSILRARERALIVSILLPIAIAVFATPAAAADPRVLFFTKSSGFQHSVIRSVDGQPSYAQNVLESLGAKYGFEVVTTKDGGVFDGDLDEYRAFVFYTTGDLLTTGSADGSPPMTEKGKKSMFRAIHKMGVGFIGIHSATDTFHSPGERNHENRQLDPYIEMIGGEFVTHGAPQVARMTVVDRSFPGWSQLGEGFELHEEWYSLKNFASDLHVLLIQETAGMKGRPYERPPYPATWLRYHGAGRVFYTSMGHGEEAWDSDVFQRVLLTGILWSLRDTDSGVSHNMKRFAPKARLKVYPSN